MKSIFCLKHKRHHSEAGGVGGADENRFFCGHGGAEERYLAEGNEWYLSMMPKDLWEGL